MLVTQGWLSDLQNQATQSAIDNRNLSQEPQALATHPTNSSETFEQNESACANVDSEPINGSDSDSGQEGLEDADQHQSQPMTNPLVSDPPNYYSPVSNNLSC